MTKRTVRKRFPLWLHAASGQWCKKIHGKRHYFGDDKEKALGRYETERAALEDGLEPGPSEDDYTVRLLVNEFLTYSSFHKFCNTPIDTNRLQLA